MKYTLGILPLTGEHFLRLHGTYEGAREGLFWRGR